MYDRHDIHRRLEAILYSSRSEEQKLDDVFGVIYDTLQFEAHRIGGTADFDGKLSAIMENLKVAISMYQRESPCWKVISAVHQSLTYALSSERPILRGYLLGRHFSIEWYRAYQTKNRMMVCENNS